MFDDRVKDVTSEWLLSNGIGGFSSSTIANRNSRKYHGMLIASYGNLDDRRLLVSKLEEELDIKGENKPLYSNQYHDGIYPKDCVEPSDFNLSPLPQFTYELDSCRLTKTVCMPRGKNATIIRYSIDEGKGRFRARPLVNDRNIHSLTKQGDFNFNREKMDKGMLLHAEKDRGSFIAVSSDLCKTEVEGDYWLNDMYYKEEQLRGYDFLEDHYISCLLSTNFRKGSVFHVILNAGTDKQEVIQTNNALTESAGELLLEESRRIGNLTRAFRERYDTGYDEPTINCLVNSADSFLCGARPFTSLIAGYHWFGSWGRDSLISLPGILRATDDTEAAKDVIRGLLKNSRNGILPNILNQGNGSAYNSIDASLLLFRVCEDYVEYTKDVGFIDEIWPGLKDIIEHYKNGTDYGIKAGDDMLINSTYDKPMTWMDAYMEGQAPTLRRGKPVEVQALWYNALKTAAAISKSIEENSYDEDAKIAKENFNQQFWNEEGFLYDFIEGDYKDGALRPNQIFAVSLPFEVLEKNKWKPVVDVVEEKLLTPYGLRTLSPEDSRYKGEYYGNQYKRDMAYHQGTVWPWLLAPFLDAYTKVKGKEKVRSMLKPLLEEHLWEQGIGTISEVFDGNEPYNASGCISQAWSVAEIIRVITKT